VLPVRKIPKNYRSVTGRIAKHNNGDSAGFESTLERDHYIVLSFDPLVATFVEQPVQIAFTDASGKPRTYTPDALERYTDGSRRLVEVKYVNELRRLIHEDGYADVIRAGRAYAKSQGWRYHVLTELEIRTPAVDNARLLLEHRDERHPPARVATVMGALQAIGPTPLRRLLEHLSNDREEQARWLNVVYHVIANGRTQFDWRRVRLNNTSILEAVGERQ
jgi:TnsA endonuclease N terminal